MKRPSPIGSPPWKMIRNVLIIAGILVAVFITWKKQERRAMQEREIAQAIERQKEAREKALAEANELKETRRREAELAASKINRNPVKTPEPAPPVAIPSQIVDKSDPTPRTKPLEDTPQPKLPVEIVTLNTKARDLVISAARKRSEQLAENARKLSWNLDLHLRTLPKSDQIGWLPHINRIKGLIENNRIPASILKSGEVEFSRKMEEVTGFAITKQKQIDQGFIAESAKIHSSYVRKLGDAAKQAEAAGQKPLSALLARTLNDATNLGAWLRSLGVDDAARTETP